MKTYNTYLQDLFSAIDICDSKAILKVIISIVVLVFVPVAKHLSVLLILFTRSLNITLFVL